MSEGIIKVGNFRDRKVMDREWFLLVEVFGFCEVSIFLLLNSIIGKCQFCYRTIRIYFSFPVAYHSILLSFVMYIRVYLAFMLSCIGFLDYDE